MKKSSMLVAAANAQTKGGPQVTSNTPTPMLSMSYDVS
jgi:hypothetical protein